MSTIDEVHWGGKDRLSNVEDAVKAIQTGGSITAIFNAADQYGADNTGAADATAKIQAALDAAHTAGGGTVYVKRGSYTISASGNTGPNSVPYSLKTYSNVSLVLDPDATITLAASSNCCMLVNAAWVAGSGRDSNIEVCGGTWARGANSGTGQGLHSILLQRSDEVSIHDLSVTSTAGKFSVCLYACTNFDVRRLTFNSASDGVHLDGACSGGRISGIYGTTGDDCVSLTPIDYTAEQNGDFGDITDVIVENVFATATNGSGVKAIGGTASATAYACRRITIRNIKGSFNNAAVYLGGDSNQAATTGGNLYDISVDSAVNTNAGQKHVRIIDIGTGGKAYNIVVSRIPFNDSGASVETIAVESATQAVAVANLIVRDCYWTGSTNSTAPVLVNDGGTGCSIDELTIQNCTLAVSNAFLIQMQGTSPTVNTVKAGPGVRLALTATNGGFIRAAGSTSPSLTNLMLAQIDASRCSWVAGDIGGTGSYTVNLFVDGVSAGTVLGLLNIRSGSTVKIRKAHGLTGSHACHIANAGTLNGLIQTSGTGAPTNAGQVGDLYDRQDSGSGTYRYRCTVAGDDGAATWTGIL